MNIALLTAAGGGTRMNQDIPKQFMHVENRPIIIHTLEAFQNHPSIDAIIVVTIDSWKDVLSAYAKQFNIDKLKWIVSGGSNGQESIKNGIDELSKFCSKDDVVLIHDGNRPMVSQEIISDSLATFERYGSSITAIPCVEAVFESENKVSSVISIERERLLRTQTPHVYKLDKLIWAHNEAKNRNIIDTAATCTLMQILGETIYFSKGSERNLKITTVDDMIIFKALLNTKKDDWIK